MNPDLTGLLVIVSDRAAVSNCNIDVHSIDKKPGYRNGKYQYSDV